jgi:PA domain
VVLQSTMVQYFSLDCLYAGLLHSGAAGIGQSPRAATHPGIWLYAWDCAGSDCLIQRGTCTFGTKVLNAQNAGATGAVGNRCGLPCDRTGARVAPGTYVGPERLAERG